MTNPLVRIAELEAQIAELKKQLQEDKASEQLFGRLGSFQAYGEEYVGVCVSNEPDLDGDVRMFYLDEDGDSMAEYRRPENVKWLTGNVLTSSEDIEELPVGTVVCLTNSPNKVAIKAYEDGHSWRRSDGYVLANEALTEGVEVIRYGTGIGN